jgi:hypothetical protein
MDGVLAGSEEPVFRVLPQRVIRDMQRPDSESALLWNLIYPRAQPTLAMEELLSLRPLWGSRVDPVSDGLVPYYWGFSQMGARLPQLDHVLEIVDGPGPKTEVDLFLFGERELVLVEAKHMAGLGRCGRYGSKKCPEIHTQPSAAGCRYWTSDESLFSNMLDFGIKPEPKHPAPICDRHYQLGRTALVGSELAKDLDRRLHLWLILPRSRWGALRRDWIDFSERIGDDSLWRRLRVLAWEDVISLAKHPSNRQIPQEGASPPSQNLKPKQS